jgi:hypothetical protein
VAVSCGLPTPKRGHKRPRKYLFLGDVHVPHHDEEAVAVAIALVKSWQPDEVWQLGDLCEAGAFSTHPRRSRNDDKPHPWRLELDCAAAFWDEIHTAAPRAACHWRLGNHEGRIERELMRVPWGEGIADLVSPVTVVASSRSWLTVHPWATRSDARPLMVLPDLAVPHGAAEGRHATAAHLDLFAPYSVVHGHTHRIAHVVRRLANGAHQHALSPGCLARRQPAFMGEKPSGHAHGTALITVPDEGPWGACVVTIEGEDGRKRCVLPWGQEVTA